MNDRCETCGWYSELRSDDQASYGTCQRSAPRPMTQDIDETSVLPAAWWPRVDSCDFCGEHTAIQRRRDRLMLAGQALSGLFSDAETLKACGPQGEIAKHMLSMADAILIKAEEEDDAK